MNPDRWARLEDLYHRALEQPAPSRSDFLNKECGGDEELRREVDGLLAAESQEEGFLEGSAFATEAQRLAEDSTDSWIGKRIGNYELLSLLGAGGMAEVYRARDSKLQRDVAIKVLPATFADDAARVRRLEKEARTLASLSHPHIGAIYGLEDTDERYALILELIEGPTLSERLEQGPIPVPEAIRFAEQIAAGLEAAYEKGITHRDLKPANIKIAPGGIVKLLDFGLAKGFGIEQQDAGSLLSMEGVIAGTPAYMSPEQARGQTVDQLTDIWAFGCVLYQMLTGDAVFAGETVSDTIAAVLVREPVWNALPAETPPALRRLVEGCLKKNREERIQEFGEIRAALAQAGEDSKSGRKSGAALRRWRWAAAGATVLAIVLAAATTWWPNTNSQNAAPPPTSSPLKIVPLTRYTGDERQPSFSPEGTQVAFSWNGEKQDNFDIYIKVVGSETPLRLTQDPAPDYFPSWSPDGRTIAFLRLATPPRVELILIPALGGAERKLAEFTSSRYQFTEELSLPVWSPDGQWLVTSGQADRNAQTDGLLLISAISGEIRRLSKPPIRTYSDHDGDNGPAISPDGRSLMFVRRNGLAPELRLLSFDRQFQPAGEDKLVTTTDVFPYAAVWSGEGQEIFFAAATGNSTVYRMRATGKSKPTAIDALGSGIATVAVSPRAHRLALTRRGTPDPNIYRLDLMKPKEAPERFVSSTARDVYPQYSPDGKRVAFSSERSGTYEIWTADADGSHPSMLTSWDMIRTSTPRWSPDSSQIVFDVMGKAGGPYQIYTIPAGGGTPRQLTQLPSTNFGGSFSRDGRWIYFASDRSGELQLWKMPSAGGAPVQVTRNGGMMATESPDGKTLYYTKNAALGGLWKMPLEGGPEVQVIPSLFRYNYFVTAKGIYFVPDPAAGGTSVRFLDLASGSVRTVVQIGAPDLGLSVSPDRRYLLFDQIDSLGSDLDLVENFR